MRMNFNKKYNTLFCYILIVIALSMLMVLAIFKFSSIASVLQTIVSVLMPIIMGCIIAFLINPIMKFITRVFENWIFKKNPHPKLSKNLSLVLSCLIFLVIVVGIIAVVVPQFAGSLSDIISNMTTLYNKTSDWILDAVKDYPELKSKLTEQLSKLYTNLDKVIEQIQPMLGNIWTGALNLITFVKNFIIGFIISVYILANKELFFAQLKKLVAATFSRQTSNNIFKVSSQCNKIFSGFLTGKLIDSLIIGLLCFILMTILGMDYTTMISVIIGVTNIIPFFGPFIGAVPSALLLFLISPKQALIFIIMIIVLQQFDGNILGPKILGDSTGLPAFWVLISILIGGGLFGFVGMLFAVPTFALIYSMFCEHINQKLAKRNLPTKTSYYKDNPTLNLVKQTKVTPMTKEELEDIKILPADEVNEAK